MDAGLKSLMHKMFLLRESSVTYRKMGKDINKQFLKEKKMQKQIKVHTKAKNKINVIKFNKLTQQHDTKIQKQTKFI